MRSGFSNGRSKSARYSVNTVLVAPMPSPSAAMAARVTHRSLRAAAGLKPEVLPEGLHVRHRRMHRLIDDAASKLNGALRVRRMVGHLRRRT